MSNCYPTPQSLQDFQTDIETVGEYVNGNDGVPNYNRDGENVKNLQTINAEVLALAAGAANLQTYLTKADMDADTSQPALTVGQVTNDSDPSLNGYYIWTGATWTRSGIQPVNSADFEALRLRVIRTSAEFMANPASVPLYVDDVGNVLMWTEGERIFIRYQMPANESAVSAALVPLFVDGTSNVPVWLENGLLAALGLSPSLIDSIRADVGESFASQNTPTGSPTPRATDGKTLYEIRARLAKAVRSGNDVARILLVGDSWAQLPEIAQASVDLLYDAFGYSATGWVPVYPEYPLNGTVVTRTGTWTLYDASNVTTPPPYGCGVDGHGFYTSAVNGGWTATMVCTEFTYFYWDADGTFRYRMDGGAWTEVAGGGTNTLQTIEFTGLTDGSHTFEMDNSVNTGGGVVTLLGGYATRNAVPGVEFSKCGNGGQTGARMLNISGFIAPYIEAMQPSLVFMILGTNDYRQGFSTVSLYEQALQMWIDEVRAVNPDCGFVFLAPPQSNAVAVTPLSEYRDAAYRVALANRAEFLNMFDDWASYAAMNAIGVWGDSLHPNAAGGEIIARSFFQRFFTF